MFDLADDRTADDGRLENGSAGLQRLLKKLLGKHQVLRTQLLKSSHTNGHGCHVRHGVGQLVGECVRVVLQNRDGLSTHMLPTLPNQDTSKTSKSGNHHGGCLRGTLSLHMGQQWGHWPLRFAMMVQGSEWWWLEQSQHGLPSTGPFC